MSITNSNLWGQLQPYFYAEVDARTSRASPRIRIELKPLPPSLEAEALSLQMPCVACGKPMNPIRARIAGGRAQSGKLYYACCCPLSVNVGCSRGGAARAEYDLMRRTLP